MSQLAWRVLTTPLVALLVHAAARWAWHAPPLFEAALAHRGVHALQHLSFLVTAGLFWWSIVHGRLGRAGYGVAVLAVFATAAHTGLLGAIVTLAPAPFYGAYVARARALGIDALADQQVAGLVMWVAAGFLLTCIGLALFAAWLGDVERRAMRRRAL
jgi:cytochrome c oxidase assembly factor CtaG